MPVIEPGNTQQIFQMSSAVEKMQTQQVQHLPSEPIQTEIFNKLKKEKAKQVKKLENSEETQATDPKGHNSIEIPPLKKPSKNSEENLSEQNVPSGFPESPQGENLNIVA